MLRKFVLAVGAVALCGAVHSQAAMSSFGPPQNGGDQHGGNQQPGGGPSFNGGQPQGNQPKGGDSYGGEKGDQGDKGGCVKIIVPEFDSNCDLVKWIQTLDCGAKSGNVFDELVVGCNPMDLGFCLPKCEVKILGDLRSDIKDVDKDFDEISRDEHDSKGYGDKFSKDDREIKELQGDINCDLKDIKTDLCDFASGLKDDCNHGHDCDHHEPTCAVPLPAAASQGLLGLGLLGCLSFVGAARRRVFGRA